MNRFPFPRVGAARQPWAEGRSPVGAGARSPRAFVKQFTGRFEVNDLAVHILITPGALGPQWFHLLGNMAAGDRHGQAPSRKSRHAADNGLVSKRILSRIRRVSRLAEHWLAGLAVIAVAGCQTTSGPVHSPESALATVTVPEPLMVALPAPLPLPPVETNEPAVASSGPYC